MEDVFMKYGMIIVGIAVISILLVFVFQALNKTSLVPTSKHQSVEGDSSVVEFRIKRLCEFCLNEKYLDRDCYLVDVKLTEGNLTNDDFAGSITLDQDLNPGEHLVKIINKDARCEVSKIE